MVDFIRGVNYPEWGVSLPGINKYDFLGNKIENQYSDGDFQLETIYEYEYDAKNNWIKVIINKDKKPKFIIERTIEYY